MRTFTVEHTVYKFDELTDEAKKRALEDARQHEWENGMEWWLPDEMQYKLDELLEEHGIYGVDTRLHYSLGYSQGDGASFTGDIEWGAWRASIEKNQWGNHYEHWNSVDVMEMTSLKTDKDAPEETRLKLLGIIHDIGRELESHGYEIIEANTSDLALEERLTEDDYEFYSDGSRV